MDSVLRPREIQARIRAGATPDAVAAAAGTTVEKIMGFAAPVLAERAYIVEQAQRASVRRRVGDGPVRRLGEAVAQRLAEDELEGAAVEWDAWRREDGRWTVRAELPRPGAAAEFTYDAAGRYVVAEDEESRRLVGERRAVPHEPTQLAQPAQPAAHEPGAGGPAADEAQLPLGDDAIELVTGRRPTPLVTAEEATVDLSETVAGVAALQGGPVAVPAASRTREDWMLTQATSRRRPADEADEQPAQLFEVVPTEPTEPAVESAEELVAPAAQVAGRPTARPAPRAVPRTATRGARGRGRAQVPSWDEIMFGSSRPE